MFNTYGMCATSPAKDYCHHVQTAIRAFHPDCRFAKLHGSGFEHADTMDAFEAWWSTAENVYTKKPARESFPTDLDLIVIQLTDNVNTEAKVVVFDQTADILLRRIRQRCPRARILWVHGCTTAKIRWTASAP